MQAIDRQGTWMKYRVEHEFPCDATTLMRTMYEADIGTALLPRMTRVTEYEALSHEDADGHVRRRTRYLPVPAIRAIGPKTVPPKWMEWVEESDVDISRRTVTYRNLPTTPKIEKRLKNSGEMTFEELPGGRSKRILTGELRVEVFLLGAIAERIIFAYAREILDEEAHAMAAIIAERQTAPKKNGARN